MQVVSSRDKLGIDPEKLNGMSGSITVGRPWHVAQRAVTGHALIEAAGAGQSMLSTPMCFGGGIGAAGLLVLFH